MSNREEFEKKMVAESNVRALLRLDMDMSFYADVLKAEGIIKEVYRDDDYSEEAQETRIKSAGLYEPLNWVLTLLDVPQDGAVVNGVKFDRGQLLQEWNLFYKESPNPDDFIAHVRDSLSKFRKKGIKMEIKQSFNNCVLPCKCGSHEVNLVFHEGYYQVQCQSCVGCISGTAKNADSAISSWNRLQMENYQEERNEN